MEYIVDTLFLFQLKGTLKYNDLFYSLVISIYFHLALDIFLYHRETYIEGYWFLLIIAFNVSISKYIFDRINKYLISVSEEINILSNAVGELDVRSYNNERLNIDSLQEYFFLGKNPNTLSTLAIIHKRNLITTFTKYFPYKNRKLIYISDVLINLIQTTVFWFGERAFFWYCLIRILFCLGLLAFFTFVSRQTHRTRFLNTH